MNPVTFDHDFNFIYRPYCVQICFIKKDRKAPGMSLSGELLDYEYMGSAEFEFGQLPASAFEIASACEAPKSKHDHWSLPTIKLIIADQTLYVKGAFLPEQVEDITRGIKSIWEDKARLKEPARFNQRSYERSLRPDNIYGSYSEMLWWDIRNHYVFTFNESAAKKVSDWLGVWHTHAKTNEFIEKRVSHNQYRRFTPELIKQIKDRLANN